MKPLYLAEIFYNAGSAEDWINEKVEKGYDLHHIRHEQAPASGSSTISILVVMKFKHFIVSKEASEKMKETLKKI